MNKPKTRSSVETPCPICGRTKDNDCQFNDEVVQCHTHLGGADIKGYVYRGDDSGGMWGLFFPQPETERKEVRPERTLEHDYPLTDGGLIQVVRTDSGQGKKSFFQRYRSTPSGQWLKSIPEDAKPKVRLYRIDDPMNRDAIANGKPIFIVEGESCVETLLSIDIPATTSIKGASGWNSWGHSNYVNELSGANLVICPDRDKVGLKYVDAIEKDFPDSKWLYAKPKSPFWGNLPEKNGLDIADWIGDLRRDGLEDAAIRDRIYQAVEGERRGKASSDEVTKTDIEAQLAQGGTDFLAENILPTDIARPLAEYAKRLNAPQGVFISIFLAACASLIKTKTRVRLPGGTGYTQPAIMWVCLYGESGNAKSPALKAVLSGIDKLHFDSYTLHKNELEQYEAAYNEWDSKPKKERGPEPRKPARRIYKLNDLTTESVIQRQYLQPDNGFLVAVDEWAGLFNSFGQYKGGGGNDREYWLSFYDGSDVEQARIGRGETYLEATGFSVVGGIQPSKLKKCMGKMEEQDGFWPRLSLVRMPTRRIPDNDDLPPISLDSLDETYRRLDSLPQAEIELTPEAKKLWREWSNWIEDTRLSEGHEALRTLYPKARGKAARIALILQAISGTQAVSAENMQAAIEFTKWLISQSLSIYDEMGLADNPEADKLTRFIEKFRDSDWIKARAVTHWSTEKWTASDARKFMAKVVGLGYAIDNGEDPLSSKYQIKIIFPNPSNKVTKVSELPPDKPLGVLPPPSNSLVTASNKIATEGEVVTSVTSCYQPPVTESNADRVSDTDNLLPCYHDQVINKNSGSVDPQTESEDRYGGVA